MKIGVWYIRIIFIFIYISKLQENSLLKQNYDILGRLKNAKTNHGNTVIKPIICGKAQQI